MKPLKKPDINKIEIYNDSCNSIKDKAKANKLLKYLYIYLLNICDYQRIIQNNNDNDIRMPIYMKNFVNYEDIKNDIKNLYKCLINNKKPKKYYNRIMDNTNLRICPNCGVGVVSTLDHYLPKDKFSIFSVYPNNLIPCCKDCNTNKSNKLDRVIHPYFDDFSKYPWLYAKLNWQKYCINFYVDVPKEYTKYKLKIENSFKILRLNKLYSANAISEIIPYMQYLKEENLSCKDIEQELKIKYNMQNKVDVNSWKTALYRCLYEDKLFHSNYKEILNK